MVKQAFNFENKQLIELCKANLAFRQGNFEILALIVEKISHIAREKSIKMTSYREGNLFDIYLCRSSIGMLVKMVGEEPERFHKFVDNYRLMLSKNPGYAPLAEGEYCYERNRLSDAIPFILSAINEAIETGCSGALIPAIATLARIKRAWGDMDGALNTVKEYEGWLEKRGKPHWIYLLNAFKTRLYIDSGNTEEVDKWFASCKLGIYNEISRVKEYELIVYARVLIVKGLLSDAEILLNRLLIFAEEAGRLHSKIEILNLLSIAAVKMGDEAHSVCCLEKALAIGKQEGYIRSFTDELAPMCHLLKTYVKCRGKQDELAVYAETLLESAVKDEKVIKARRGRSCPNFINQLTLRENKVLQLIAAGRSNSEIAKELGISLSTVKYHNVNLFGKLEAKNRLEAINRAKKSGLLD